MKDGNYALSSDLGISAGQHHVRPLQHVQKTTHFRIVRLKRQLIRPPNTQNARVCMCLTLCWCCLGSLQPSQSPRWTSSTFISLICVYSPKDWVILNVSEFLSRAVLLRHCVIVRRTVWPVTSGNDLEILKSLKPAEPPCITRRYINGYANILTTMLMGRSNWFSLEVTSNHGNIVIASPPGCNRSPDGVETVSSSGRARGGTLRPPVAYMQASGASTAQIPAVRDLAPRSF